MAKEGKKEGKKKKEIKIIKEKPFRFVEFCRKKADEGDKKFERIFRHIQKKKSEITEESVYDELQKLYLSREESKPEYFKRITPNLGVLLFRLFLKEFGIYNHQLSSYDYLLVYGLNQLFNTIPPIRIDAENGYVTAKFMNPILLRPGIWEASAKYVTNTPNECRIRSQTYSADVLCDVSIETHKTGDKTSKKVHRGIKLGELPIMVKSLNCISKKSNPFEIKECPYDEGAYFIINGHEKTIISQRKGHMNYPSILKPNDKGTKIQMQCEMRSRKENRVQSLIKLLIYSDDLVYLRSEGVVTEIPFFSLLNACHIPILREEDEKTFSFLDYLSAFSWIDPDGIDRSNELNHIIMKNIERSEFDSPSRETFETMGKREFKDYIKEYGLDKNKSREELINDIYDAQLSQFLYDNDTKRFFSTFMPHVMGGRFEIGVMLTNMFSELMKVRLSMQNLTDRDNFSNVRMETAGTLIYQLIRRVMAKLCADIQKKYLGIMKKDDSEEPRKGFGKKIPRDVDRIDIVGHITTKQQLNAIHTAFATGNWNTPGSSDSSVGAGVCQLLQRNSAPQMRNSRQISAPTTRSGKQTEQRQLHPSSLGFVCPAETPEGQSCGLVGNLALSCSITNEVDIDPIMSFLTDYIGKFKSNEDLIFVNGSPIGTTDNGSELAKKIRTEKLRGVLSIFMGIVYDPFKRHVQIRAMQGRLIRPLLVVKEGKIQITREEVVKLLEGKNGFTQLAREGKIEFVDPLEQEFIKIAEFHDSIRDDDTHCEIHPALLLGVSASTIPLPDHNQSPRNTYQSAMGKQAAGTSSLAEDFRTDICQNRLLHTERPLVSSSTMDEMGYNSLPSGLNVMVAILNYTGANQEDSLLFRQSFLDRGGFTGDIRKTYLKKKKKLMGEFKIPRAPYLDEMGMPKVGSVLNNHQIIIGEPNIRDSIGLATINPQTVSKSEIFDLPNGDRIAKVVTRERRIPIVGDKFAARHGQKGVIGAVLKDEDMPFIAGGNNRGIMPDIIINPQAIPSRMTIAMLIEMLLSKLCAITGEYGDATPFDVFTPDKTDDRIEQIGESLKEYGFQPQGEEVMTCGMTGEMMQGTVFMCPCFYQRLKHMVLDKIQARSSGARAGITGQPQGGRALNGGLRIGEMERDCFISHGVSEIIKERFCELSDEYVLDICTKCGILSTMYMKESYEICKKCKKLVKKYGDGNPDCKKCKTIQTPTCKVCEKTKFRKVKIPYAMKLLIQQKMAMGILPQFRFNKK